MKLSNTMKHFSFATLAGAFNGMAIRFVEVPEAAVFNSIAFLLFTIAFELAQKLQSTDPNYLGKKWLDSLIDILAGNAGFNLLTWLILLLGGWYAGAI